MRLIDADALVDDIHEMEKAIGMNLFLTHDIEWLIDNAPTFEEDSDGVD